MPRRLKGQPFQHKGPPLLVNRVYTTAASVAAPTAYTLDALVANITYSGGAHGMVVGRNLAATVANITYTGGAHTFAVAHFLTSTAANIIYTGGAHSLLVSRLLTATAANITYLGKDHTLTYTPGSAGVAYTLTSITANITFTGGSDELTYTANTPEPTVQIRPGVISGWIHTDRDYFRPY